MAYAKINQLLEGDDQAGSGKADIFGGGDQQGLSLTGDPATTEGAPASDAVKTSTEGQVNTGASQQAAAAQQQADTEDSAVSRDVITRNIGRQQAPTTLADIGSRLETAKTTLEDEAASYLAGRGEEREGQYGGDRTETYEGAISGDEPATQYVQDLGTTQQQYGEDRAFDPTTNVAIAPGLASATYGANAQAADEVVRGYLQREQGPQYTRAESDLDLALLRQIPGYQQQLRDLGATQRELTEQYGRIGEETSTQAYEADEAARQAALDAARGYFGGEIESLYGAQEDELAAFQEALAQQTPESFGGDVRSALAAEQVDPYLAQQIGLGAGVDPTQYFTGAPLEFGAEEFFDQTEADRYNRIMELLGGAHVPEGRAGRVEAGGLGAGIESEFDADAYRTALLAGAQGQARTLDDQIAAIIRRGETGLEDYQGTILADPYKGLQGDVSSAIQAIEAEYGPSGIAGFVPEAYEMSVPNYITPPEMVGLGYEDFLSPEDLAELERLTGERMQPHERAEYASQTPGAYTFDRDRFIADALGRLARGEEIAAQEQLDRDRSENAGKYAVPGNILIGESAPTIDKATTPPRTPEEREAGQAAIDAALGGGAVPTGSVVAADPDSFGNSLEPRAATGSAEWSNIKELLR